MKKLLTILVLIMLIISFFQITNMYALYKDQIEGEYSTLLGAWEIRVNGTDITSSGQVETFTIDADTQLGYISSEYIQAGKIAPNGQAYFDIVIDPSNIYVDDVGNETVVYNDVSIIYQINMESTDIPNVQIDLLSVDNLFKKDGETDVTNTEVNLDGNLYTAVIPMDKINDGYKNHLRLTFKWTNVEDYNTADSALVENEIATNENITWTSSDESIATVSNGVITAVAVGTATITVKTEDGNYTDTCTVTVSEETVDKVVSASSVILNTTQVSLKKGETETLRATVLPEDVTNKNITWTSNNEEVATVTNGVVTGVAEGTATITAKSTDGNYTRTCAVTVTGEDITDTINVVGVDLNKTAVTLKQGETEALKASVWPENAKLSIPLKIEFKQYTGEGVGNESE